MLPMCMVCDFNYAARSAGSVKAACVSVDMYLEVVFGDSFIFGGLSRAVRAVRAMR